MNSGVAARADERPKGANRTREGRRERPKGVSGEAGEARGAVAVLCEAGLKGAAARRAQAK
ncbi:hypothetical protein C463_04464 [Halorubrum californiense DSM 19288]|uniref:Uncharacterized protein n=1 Tax=Halorubrum californiense DSM 19288 TaxID=1227465 RepID=M0EF99_9EURY|nr:hypothetical protein [Halorubrum californiense]ELZ46435.1 hypothetical protein C463_04464 [Halorubrum californiense DSM 19288]